MIHTATTYACQVLSVAPLSADTFEFELQSPEGAALDYQAGQHLALELDLEGDGNLQSLFYSIANSCDPAQPRRLQLFIQNSSAFSARVIQHLTELHEQGKGAQVTLPLGNTVLNTDLDKPHLLIAAGSGISQIKALTEELLQRKPDAEVKVYWSNRRVDEFYLLDAFQGWAVQNANLSFTPILESADSRWQGRTGYIFEVIQADGEKLDDTQAYLCGSPDMVYGTIDQLKSSGLREENCYSDVFEYAPREREVAV